MPAATILVVDDDPDLCAILGRFLQDEGYAVLTSCSGREALACLDRVRPDLLLLDLVMPQLDGYAVLDALRHRGQEALPVLVFSAYRPDATLLATIEAEWRDFIAKPFDLDELHVRLQRLLHRAHPVGPARSSTAPLRVCALGTLRVFRGQTLLFDESWRNKPAKGVFKVLLTHHGQRVPSEALAEALWPEADPEDALNRLRVAMHGLRQHLGDLKGQRPQGQGQLLVQQEGSYVFDAAGQCWTDVRTFAAALDRARELAAQEQWEEALAAYQQAEALYGGDYLQDDPLAEWSVAARERLGQVHLALLQEMAQLWAHQGEVDAAVRTCRTLLHREPWREEVYRWLMTTLAVAGRTAEALRVFEDCRRALAAEELELAPATRQLRARIAARAAQECR